MKISFDEVVVVDGKIIYVLARHNNKKTYYYTANKKRKIINRVGPRLPDICYKNAGKILFEKNFNFQIKKLLKLKKTDLKRIKPNDNLNDVYMKRLELLDQFGIQYLNFGFILIKSQRHKGKNCKLTRIKDLDTAIRQQGYILQSYNRNNAVVSHRHTLLGNEHNWLKADLKNAAAKIRTLVNRNNSFLNKNQTKVLAQYIFIKGQINNLWPAPYCYRAYEAMPRLKVAQQYFEDKHYREMRRVLAEAHRWLLEY
ncbi:MAG: hypothetical protein U9Q85_03145 [Patescibacteria group bacterium]|nr:hypothetical protein [Patescibacteria group bacterium]